MTKKEIERQEAAKELRRMIRPSSTIGIAIKSVSSSGMSRRMRVYASDFRDITHLAAKAMGMSSNDKGILVGGCGMDMTFWLADKLSRELWGNGPKKGYKGNGGGCIGWRVL